MELNGIITDAFANLKLYNNYNRDYWKHRRWLDQQIISNTSNILHEFECVYKKGEDGEWNPKDLEFHKKLKKIQKFVARFSNNKSKTVPWCMQALKAAMQ